MTPTTAVWVFLLLTATTAVVNARQRVVTVCFDRHERIYTLEGHAVASCANPAATAKLSNKINETGWGFLEVETEDVPLHVQAYAAGVAEGQLTRSLIFDHLRNTVEGYCDGAEEYCQRLGVFMLKNYEWMQSQISSHPNDVYWQQVNFTMTQMQGLIDGYEQKKTRLSPNDIVIHPIYLLQMAGDFEDLETVLQRPPHLRKRVLGSGHCSALVKAAPNNEDLFFSHVTWTSYGSMLRLQKLYKFKQCIPGHTNVFSGYPGTLSSDDDFVLSSSGLAITETTIGNYNKQLFRYVKPATVFTWIRSQIANRLARTGREWALIFKKQNSGTYNNQWTIVDYKLFHPGQELPREGLLYVLEQLPGYVEHADLTGAFEDAGYWPSYNIPYFKRVFNMSDSWTNVKQYGDWFTYDRNPRALIFRRDEHKVVDMDSLQRLMRSNNYKNDPLSRCNCTPPYSAENAISCRSELNPKDGKYPFAALGFRDHGATDMKATNSEMMKTLRFRAIAGPTYDPLPVFDWRTTVLKDTVRHFGHPNEWRFSPIVHTWAADTNIDNGAYC